MSVASLFAPRYKGGLQQRVCPGFSPGSLLIAIRRTVAWAKLSVFMLTAPCFYINVLNLTYRQVNSELTDMTAQYIGTRHKNYCRNMDQDTGDRKAESNRTKGLLTPKKRHGESSMNVKGHLLRRKRYPFRLQKMVFQEPKDHLLQHAEYQYIMKAHEKRSVLPQNQPAH